MVSGTERRVIFSSGTIGSAAAASERRARRPKISRIPITSQVPTRTSGILPPPIISRKFIEVCKNIISAAAILAGAAERSTPGFNNCSGHLSQDSERESHTVNVRAPEDEKDQAHDDQHLERYRHHAKLCGGAAGARRGGRADC